MGEKGIKETGPVVGQPDPSSGGNPGGGPGPSTPSGGSTPGQAPGGQGQGIPRLVMVTPPGSSAGAGAAAASPPAGNKRGPKPKKPITKETGKVGDPLLGQNITILVQTVFDLLTVPLGPHWALLPGQAAAIGEPLGRVLERLGAGETTSKYADYIALGMALTVVIVPRVLITRAAKGGNDNVRNIRASGGNTQPQPGGGGQTSPGSKGEAAGNPGQNVGPAAANGGNVSGDIFAQLGS